jgi:hypothetical protein
LDIFAFILIAIGSVLLTRHLYNRHMHKKKIRV